MARDPLKIWHVILKYMRMRKRKINVNQITWDFPKLIGDLWKDFIRILEKDEDNLPESFDFMCNLWQKLIHKIWFILGKEIASELRGKRSPRKSSQIKEDFLESFINYNLLGILLLFHKCKLPLYFKITFSEKEMFNL